MITDAHQRSNPAIHMTEQLINVGSLVKDANDGLTAEEQLELKKQLSEIIQQLTALEDSAHLQRGLYGHCQLYHVTRASCQ